MKWASFVFGFLLLSGTFGCLDDNGARPVDSEIDWLIRNDQGGPGLEIYCPEGVECDENFDYRAFTYFSADVEVYVSFRPSLVGHYTLDDFNEAFDYLNLWIHFSNLDTDSSRFYYHPKEPLRPIIFDSYEDGRLSWTMAGTIDTITEKRISRSNECQTDDMVGECYFDEPAAIPYQLRFELSVEE